MELVQSFLPAVSRDNRVLGLIPIPKTVFTGSETTMVVNGVDSSIRLVKSSSTSLERAEVTYMALDVNDTEARSAYVASGWLDTLVPYYTWHNQLGRADFIQRETTLTSLIMGVQLELSEPPETISDLISNKSVVTWTQNVNMSASPQNAFFEVNWLTLVTASSDVSPASLTIGSPISDPSLGSVKTFLVQSSEPVLNGLTAFNTVRFVKITSQPIPLGRYVWPAVASNQDGSSTEITFVLNNV